MIRIITLLICNVGGPGQSHQAQDAVNQFLTHLKKSGEISAELKGVYLTKESACHAFIQKHNPELVVADFPTHIVKHKDWTLRPIAQMGKVNRLKYHLLVRENDKSSIKKINGLLVTALKKRKRFIEKIVLHQKLPKDIEIKSVKRPLKAIRKLARKQANSALVDDFAYRFLSQIKLPEKLITIFSSKTFPGLSLNMRIKDNDLEKRLLKALPKLCQGQGEILCKTFGVQSFIKLKPNAYKKYYQRYESNN